MERKLAGLPTPSGRTPSQRLAAERYAILLVKGRKIPKTLQKQIAGLPAEELSPSMHRQIEWMEETYGEHEKQDQALKRQRKGK